MRTKYSGFTVTRYNWECHGFFLFPEADFRVQVEVLFFIFYSLLHPIARASVKDERRNRHDKTGTISNVLCT